LETGNPPDRFVVGLAVLSLLADLSVERPLVCLVDDAQWLDEATSQVLAFVGRRLLAEPVLLLLAVRESGDDRSFPALPSLTLEGLTDGDARGLLRAAVDGPLDEQVRDRIVAETGGNPLALLELSRAMSQAELAGGFSAPGTSVRLGHIEDHYVELVRALPDDARLLILLAAADPTGDATLLWSAAQTLGIGRNAAAAAESEQLIEIGSKVRFRHPLVRSAAYVAAAPDARCAAHFALAQATNPETDPERRVWHLAAAATRPDEQLASELEHTASTARARAGLAAAAAFLRRSVELSTDPERRAERALEAAEAYLNAGAFEAALALCAEAAGVAVDNVQLSRAERLRGQVQYASNPGPEAPAALLQVARRLEPLEVELAREAYLDAWMASFAAGSYAGPGGLLLEVSGAGLRAPAPVEVRLCDLLLDGLATAVTDGRAAGAPILMAAVDGFLGDDVSDADWLKWGHVVASANNTLFDSQRWARLSARQVQVARASGALTPLTIALNGRGVFAAWSGDFEAASAIVAEEEAVRDATGIQRFSYGALLLAAYRGRAHEALPMISAAHADATARGEGQGSQYVKWVEAVLHVGLSSYEDAWMAAGRAADDMESPSVTVWALPELVEAAVRTGRMDQAHEAVGRLSEQTLEDSDWLMGIEARCRALVTDGDEAEHWYNYALERLEATGLGTEVARAHLLFGEWLRRHGRRVDARQQLQAAFDMFAAMGAEGFAERARSELLATGQRVPKREPGTRYDLTPQEEHIARLARDGRTSREIGAELFLSARTVEWHLQRAFTKLGVKSRRELKEVLPLNP
jgi:DNA-binding CsgD family transcriptional regulator